MAYDIVPITLALVILKPLSSLNITSPFGLTVNNAVLPTLLSYQTTPSTCWFGL